MCLWTDMRALEPGSLGCVDWGNIMDMMSLL